MTQQTLTQSERQGYVQSQHVLSKHLLLPSFTCTLLISLFTCTLVLSLFALVFSALDKLTNLLKSSMHFSFLAIHFQISLFFLSISLFKLSFLTVYFPISFLFILITLFDSKILDLTFIFLAVTLTLFFLQF